LSPATADSPASVEKGYTEMSRIFWIVLCLVAIAGIAQTAHAGVSIQPSYIDTKLDEGTYVATLSITALANVPERYRLNMFYFNYDENGSIKKVADDEHSIVNWVKLNPKEFTINPKETRVVRIAIVPPPGTKPGEYWSAIEFLPLEGRTTTLERQGRKMDVKVVTAILIPVIGQVGKVNYAADIQGLRAWKYDRGIMVEANLDNTGTGRVRLKGNYQLIGSDGAVVSEGLFGDASLLVGGKRILSQTVAGTFPDAYSIRVRYESEKLPDVIAGEAQVSPIPPEGWKPPPERKGKAGAKKAGASPAAAGAAPTGTPAEENPGTQPVKPSDTGAADTR
jgi:hypothetical protein